MVDQRPILHGQGLGCLAAPAITNAGHIAIARKVRRVIAVACLPLVLITLGSSRSPAQTQLLTVPLDSGTLVRMHLADGSRLRGRLLVPLEPGSVGITFCRYPGNPCTAATRDGIAAMPVATITRLDVAAGNRAILTGVGAALAVIATTALLNATVGATNDNHISPGSALGVGAIAGVIGAVAGSSDIVWRRAR